MPVITLLTDFGLADGYPGVMKGVIAGLAPLARVIDLSHEVPPQDVAAAQFLLLSAVPYFPPQTLHVVVVDPGVGSERAILYAEAQGARFLAPDNGLLSVLGRPERLREVTHRALFLERVSSTFHGRDVFAPVAARLAAGLDPAKLGPPAARMVERPLPRPAPWGGGLAGEVIHVDRFGNLITCFTGPDLAGFRLPAFQVRGRTVVGLASSYAAVPRGEYLAVLGSTGHVEIGKNLGSAAEGLAARRGERVEVVEGALEGQEPA